MKIKNKEEALDILSKLNGAFSQRLEAIRLCKSDNFNIPAEQVTVFFNSDVLEDVQFALSVFITGNILDNTQCKVIFSVYSFDGKLKQKYKISFTVCSFYKLFDSTDANELEKAVNMANALYEKVIIHLIPFFKDHTIEEIRNTFEELSKKLNADNFFSELDNKKS